MWLSSRVFSPPMASQATRPAVRVNHGRVIAEVSCAVEFQGHLGGIPAHLVSYTRLSILENDEGRDGLTHSESGVPIPAASDTPCPHGHGKVLPFGTTKENIDGTATAAPPIHR